MLCVKDEVSMLYGICVFTFVDIEVSITAVIYVTQPCVRVMVRSSGRLFELSDS